MKIIFVCTGNTCRSPMAEVMAKDIFSKKQMKIDVFSRGIDVYFPAGASENAKKFMEKYGYDLSKHLAKPISASDIQDTSLILTMTAGQKKVLLSPCKNAGVAVYTLKEFVGESDFDILDPFGQEVNVYESCGIEIGRCLEKLPDRLIKYGFYECE